MKTKKTNAVLLLTAITFFATSITCTTSAQNNDIRMQNICLVLNGVNTEIRVQYNTKTGDTTVLVNGQPKPFSQVYPIGKEYAITKSWFNKNEPVNYKGKTYLKLGEPRLYGSTELSPAPSYNDAAVFTEKDTSANPPIIFMAVRPGCEFQPYEIKDITARDYAIKGRQQAMAKDLYAAIKSFTHSIRKAPDSSVFYFYRANTHVMVNNTWDAESDYAKALKLNPRNHMIYLARGTMYLKNGDKEKAAADLQQVLKMDPENVQAKNALKRIGMAP